MDNSSKVISSDGYHWDGITRREYKTDTNNFRAVHRYSLLGDEIRELNSHTRYFEIQPGGYSSLEKHRHPHSVIVIRGEGTVVLGNKMEKIKSHDVLYIAPETIHQFYADCEQPLGFLCIVDRYRDKPAIPGDDEIREVIRDEKILKKIQK